jgi:hypothetical protein
MCDGDFIFGRKMVNGGFRFSPKTGKGEGFNCVIVELIRGRLLKVK